MNKLAPVWLLLISSLLLADGGIWVPDHNIWQPHPENQQLAAIHWEDGTQNMILSVDIDRQEPAEKAIWIFPVPASHEKIRIDVSEGFPTFSGQEIDSELGSSTALSAFASVGWATFPAGIPLLLLLAMGSPIGSVGGMEGAPRAMAAGLPEGVILRERIIRMGLTTDLISAYNSAGLEQYFTERGGTVSSESKEVLNYYVGRQYSFVVSYISNLSAFDAETRELPPVQPVVEEGVVSSSYPYYPRYRPYTPVAVFVKFPTDKIYFPLKPTSIYGKTEVPATIYVTSHVSPEVYSGISSQTKVEYQVNGRVIENYLSYDETSALLNGRESTGLKLTQIKITGPSSNFQEDLWMGPSAPADVQFKDGWLANWLPITVLLFALVAALSSVIAGRVTLQGTGLSNKKLALFGLGSVLTMPGFAILAWFLLKSPGKKGLPQGWSGKKFGYFLLFYVVFIVLCVAFWILANSLF